MVRKKFPFHEEINSMISINDLEIDDKDVKKYMLMNECPEVDYWLKHILKQVIDGHLQNNREDLIYYMIGVTDGWLEP